MRRPYEVRREFESSKTVVLLAAALSWTRVSESLPTSRVNETVERADREQPDQPHQWDWGFRGFERAAPIRRVVGSRPRESHMAVGPAGLASYGKRLNEIVMVLRR